MVTAKAVAQSIVQLVQEGQNEEQIMNHVMSFVEEHHLQASLPAIVRYLEIFQKQQVDKQTCIIEVATEQEMNGIASIAEKIGVPEGSTVQAEVNPELVGGYRTLYKGVLHDASLKTQLEKLQKHIAR